MLSDDKLLELYDRTYFIGDKEELLKSLRAIESVVRAEALEGAAKVADSNCLYDGYTVAKAIRALKENNNV